MTTATKKETLKEALTQANPNKLADALAQVDLGAMFTPVVLDTGVIPASATLTIPGNGALAVQAVRVVASGTAASVGSYLASDVGAVMAVPPGGANLGAGVCRLSADGKTITLPNTVTQAVISFIPRSAKALTAAFNRS